MRWRPVRLAAVPPALRRQSATRPLRQKGPPSPIRRLVGTQADLVARAPPDATRASGFARPANKSVPHRIARVQLESPAMPRAARANPADSTASIVRKAVHSDQFAPRFAAVH